MAERTRFERMVIAAALTEFSDKYEQTDPELAEYAEQLADKQLDWHTAN